MNTIMDTFKIGDMVTFEGYADDCGTQVVAVEFSLDGGATWTRHATEGAVPGKLLTWHFSYTPEQEGLYQLLVRSINEDGDASPLPDSVEFEVFAARS